MTGLSVDTLRAWERRYEAVVPQRNARGRVYTDREVTRLRLLAELVDRGHAIGTIAGLSDAELQKLRSRAESLADRRPEPPAVASLDALMAALDRYDLDGLEAILNRHAAALLPRDLIFAVLLPLMREVGRRWEAGALRPSQEHLVSALVRSVLGGLLRVANRPAASPKVICAAPAGERHELGLLSAGLLAAAAGYGVVYLGPDCPAADVAHAVTTTGAHVVILGVTTPRVVTRSEARALARIARTIELWIGGPQADSLIAAVGDHARRLDGLDEVVPMLSRYAR
jgi:DNA-binding transcriptional MerR regulator